MNAFAIEPFEGFYRYNLRGKVNEAKTRLSLPQICKSVKLRLVNLLASGHSTKSKMAAALGLFGRCRLIGFSGPILLQTRTFSARSKGKHTAEQHKYQDDVYLLNYRDPPSHSFTEAMSALRAYAITNVDQTVELHIKINMGDNKSKASLYFL